MSAVSGTMILRYTMTKKIGTGEARGECKQTQGNELLLPFGKKHNDVSTRHPDCKVSLTS